MAKKAKRGVKPGTKRGPYRRAKKKLKILTFGQSNFTNTPKTVRTRIPNDDWSDLNAPNSVGNNRAKEFTVTAVEGSQIKVGDVITMGGLPSLISELTSTIDALEAQLTAQIDRIKSILV